MLRAIAAAKKKNDRIDAKKICDCLRCDFLPECYMASTAIRERRRTLRYRNLLVRQMVQMKNKISMLLMEAGVSYNKQRLHKAGYFRELLATNPDIPMRAAFAAATVPRDGGAVAENRECPGALAGARFVADGSRGAVDDDSRRGPDHGADLGAGSGGCAAFFLDQESHQLLRVVRRREEFGNTTQRTPLSKQRNKHLQTTLIEAAKMAPRYSPALAMLYDKEKQKGNANRATLAVARKLVAYLMAVDRGQRNFQVAETSNCIAA